MPLSIRTRKTMPKFGNVQKTKYQLYVSRFCEKYFSVFFYLKYKKVCSVGCYADFLNGKRDLNGLGLTVTNTNGGGSITSCLAYCKARGFIFAGVEAG